MRGMKVRRALAALGALCLICSFSLQTVATQFFNAEENNEVSQAESSVSSEGSPVVSEGSSEAPESSEEASSSSEEASYPLEEIPPKEEPASEPQEPANSKDLPLGLSLQLRTVRFFGVNKELLATQYVNDNTILNDSVPVVVCTEGYEFDHWEVDRKTFDFVTQPITKDMDAYAIQRIKPAVPTYTVTFMKEYGGILQTASGYKQGDTIGSKIDPLPTPDVVDAHDIKWSNDVSLDTVVNGNVTIYPQGYRTVTFKRDADPGCNWTEDRRIDVPVGQYYCPAPFISITKTGTASGGVTTEENSPFLGWYEGEENVGGQSFYFHPTKADTILTPKFQPPRPGTVTVHIKYGTPETTITLDNVSLDAIIHLSGITVPSIQGKTHVGWEADVGGYTCGTASANLSDITTLAAGNTITLTPRFDNQTFTVTFRAPYGFKPGNPSASYYGIEVRNIAYGTPIGIDKEALDARVKLPEPNPFVYYEQNEAGILERKEIEYSFRGEWNVEGTTGLWDFTAGVTKNMVLIPIIYPLEEVDKTFYEVTFYDTYSKPFEPLETWIVLEGALPPEPPVPERAGYTCIGWSSYYPPSKQPLYNFETPVHRNLNLYAVWAQDATVTLNSDGGDMIYVEVVKANNTLSEEALETCKPEHVSNGGRVCQGWSLTKQNGALLKDLVLFDITQPFTPEFIAEHDGQIMLWAWYESESTKVNFHHNYLPEGATEEKVHTMELSANEFLRLPGYVPGEREGYYFEGWCLTKEAEEIVPASYLLPKNEITDVYAKWTSGVTLQYYVGNSLVETQFFKSRSEAIPKVDYIPRAEENKTPMWVNPEEWYTNPSCEPADKVDFETVLTDIADGAIKNLYGKLSEIPKESCTIVLNANGGVFSTGETRNQSEKRLEATKGDILWSNQKYADALKDKTKLPTGDNRISNGWFEDPACTKPADPKVPIARDETTYYQGWVCSVKFYNHQDDTMPVQEAAVSKDEGVDCKAFPERTDKDGKALNLAGWSWTYNGDCEEIKKPTSEFWDFQTNLVQNELHLKAVWEYEVVFHPENGQLTDIGTKYVRELASDRTLERPTDPTREGYTFQGWYLGAEPTDTKFVFRGEEPTPTVIDQNTELYAMWEQTEILPEPPSTPDLPVPPNPPSLPDATKPVPEQPVEIYNYVDDWQPDEVEIEDQVDEVIAPKTVPNTKLPYSGAPQVLSVLGVALILPWLSMVFFKKFKKEMLEDYGDH